MFQYITQKILSIQTKDVTTSFRRWTAVVCVIIVFVVLTFSFWSLLINEPLPSKDISAPTRSTALNDDKGVLDKFYYFDGIGITDPSTNFGQLQSTAEVAQKCKMFGDDCLGFDTLGSLFLERDRNIATLNGLQPQFKGGVYISSDYNNASEICNTLGGNFDKSKKQCTHFNRKDVRNYPFPNIN